MKIFQNLIVRLLKEETLTKLFAKQDNGDATFYSSNLRGGSFNMSNMEVKKKKVEQIIKLKKKTWCNYCDEKRHWERKCKNKEDDEKEDNTITNVEKRHWEQECKNREDDENKDNTTANVIENGKYLINTRLVIDASSEELLFT